MKLIIIFTLFTIFNFQSYSQQLDQSISEIATDLAQKVTKKNRTKLALTDFTNTEGKVDALTEYIREELEMKLINNENELQVIDRKHIKLLLSEHHLQSDGLIDESTAKSAISFIKIDGWIVAEITTLGDQIKIKVTVTDISTSQIYAASASGLISDIAIKNLLDPEIKICSECNGKGTVQMQTLCDRCNGKGNYTCANCKGNGKVISNTCNSCLEKCTVCSGMGTIICNSCAGNGKIVSYQTCQKCNGKVRLSATNIANKPSVQICDACSGNKTIKTQKPCGKCNGSGEEPFGPGSNWERRPCITCAGKGQIISFNICKKCNGTGKL